MVQTVPLGTVGMAQFKGVGSVSRAVPFSIVLNCAGSPGDAPIRPQVTLTDASDTGNRSTTLTLSAGADNASGIGLQILRNDTVLGYGPASADRGTPNQWEAGTVGQDQATFTIPLAVRHVQTAAAVGSGAANGRAIFTMSYQ